MSTKAKTTAKPTKYRILLKEGPNYRIIDAVSVTGGAGAAFRKVLKEPGTYVAVPESNWTEETFTIEQPPPKLIIAGQPAVQTTVDDQLASALDEVDAEVGATATKRIGDDVGHSVRV